MFFLIAFVNLYEETAQFKRTNVTVRPLLKLNFTAPPPRYALRGRKFAIASWQLAEYTALLR